MAKLKPAELERLALLFEEASEVIQAVGKIIRHGYHDYHPDHSNNNREHLEEELGDLLAALHIMVNCKDVDMNLINENAADKLRRVSKYTYHQPKNAFQLKHGQETTLRFQPSGVKGE